MTLSAARLKAFFTEPVTPDIGFDISRTRLAGLRYSRREKRVTAHVILPVAPGALEPSFDGKNILDAAALERPLREAKSRLGPDGSPVALLIPETCVRLHLLAFDALPASSVERDEVIRWRLGKLAPFKPDEMRLAYDVLKADGPTRVVVAMARRDVVLAYEQLFGRLGLDVRAIAIPGLYLPGLLRMDKPGLGLVVNLDEDYVSLIAVLDGDISLYRMKPFHTPAAGSGARQTQILHEVETTIHVLEDREKKAISAIWVRTAGTEGDALMAVLREKWPSTRVENLSSPLALNTCDQNILAPLIGQMLR